MVTSGSPRCPYCGADLSWGETHCPYCGASLAPHNVPLPGGLLQGPFPRELAVERQRVGWRVHHELFDEGIPLGRFSQYWHGGIRYRSPRGLVYRTQGGRLLRFRLRWVCERDLVGWVEQAGRWVRHYRVGYGGDLYELLSASPMSRSFFLQGQTERRLLQARPAGLARSPFLTIYAPLSLELLAMVYAAILVLWRQIATV
ncbi:MAG: zinc ribbon domain-containing protein [Chloroflexia bacterium]|nr:zinc ribbon domain-containing protein [Chloroflexia bacterium]